MDQALYARSYLYERSVVGHHYHAAFHVVAHLQVGIQSVPRMRSELLQAECDTLLLLVEVEYHHVDLVVEVYYLVRIAYAAPRKVGDVNQSVYASQVYEYAIRSDVLDGSFQDLSLLQLADDFLALLLQLSLDESLVGDNHVAELLVDFHYLELHGLAHEDIVIPDGVYVDLATRQEGLYAKYVYDHATLGAALDVSLYNLLLFQSLVDTIPALAQASLLV